MNPETEKQGVRPLRRIGLVVLYVIVFLFLVFPVDFLLPFPAPLIAKTLQMVTGNQYLDCSGYICFDEPTDHAWFLILCFYLIFFVIFLLLKYLTKKQAIAKSTGTVIFSLLLLFSYGSLIFVTEEGSCSILKDSDMTGHVRSLCYNNRALKTGDAANCSKIEGSDIHDGCYYAVARIKNEPPLCLLIHDERKRKNCWDFLNSAEWINSR